MSGDTPGAYASGQDQNFYWPRHEAPEPDYGLLERQAREADEFRYNQLMVQFLAESAAQHGPLRPDAAPLGREAFIGQQRRIAADAIARQEQAKRYADHKREQVSNALYGDGKPYIGRHRAEDVAAPAPPAGRHAAKETGPSPETSVGEILARLAEEDEQQVPEQPPATAEEPEPTEPQQKRRLRNVWYAAGAAVGAWLAHPEKGSRRQTTAVMLGYAAVATVAYLAGKHSPFENPFDGTNPFDDAVQPPPQPSPEGQGLTGEFVNNLQPQGYNGEAYEWSAVANQVGEPNATPKLLQMISESQSAGLYVDTWGDPPTGQWGIDSVTVLLQDGTYLTYRDTPHKLALIQYMSELSKIEYPGNT